MNARTIRWLEFVHTMMLYFHRIFLYRSTYTIHYFILYSIIHVYMILHSIIYANSIDICECILNTCIRGETHKSFFIKTHWNATTKTNLFLVDHLNRDTHGIDISKRTFISSSYILLYIYVSNRLYISFIRVQRCS